MAKAKPATESKTVTTPAVDMTVPTGYQEPTAKGTVTQNPSVLSDKELIAKTNADNKAKADAEKAVAAELKAVAKAAKDAEKAKVKAEKEEARAKAKAEREARLAELAASGKAYTGSMLALADRVKTGAYVKGATGQLRSNDELAVALDGVSPTDVIAIALDVLKIEENPYHKLNVGQQSMNLRNRMRGAIKKETIKLSDVTDYMVRNKIHVTTPADLEARAKEKAERKAKVDAAKAAKAAKPAVAPAAGPVEQLQAGD